MKLRDIEIPEISLRNKRRAAFVLLIFLVAVMGKSGFVPKFSSVSPMLMVPLTVIIALYEKSIPGMAYGILCGALWDLTATTPDGFYTVLLAAAGFVCGCFSTFFVRTNLFSSLLLTFFTAVGCCLFHWGMYFLSKGYDGALGVIFSYYFPSVLYTLVFSVIFYYVISYIVKHTREKKKLL